MALAIEPEADPSVPEALEGFAEALQPDPQDPQVARARAAIEARLLGVPAVPPRIGRFVVLDRLGAGGMGVVHSAYDPQLDRKVAIKLLFARDAAAVVHARLVAEAKTMAKLAHPNVVHVYEVGEHRGQLFVAMELVRGRTLRRWWSETPRSVTETLAMCLQAGAGLAAAHAAGIVHCDFKPDNVLVGDDGRARVLDFGLARTAIEVTLDDVATASARGRDPVTGRSGSGVGTPGYAAPEQMRGNKGDPRSDQFSFCATVWEALVGTRPFAGRTANELLDAIDNGRIAAPPRGRMPTWIERPLRRGLTTTERFGSLDELLDVLSRDPARRRRRRVWIGLGVIGIASAFAFGVAWTRDADPCRGGPEVMQAAWPDAVRAAAFERIASTGGRYGIAMAPTLATDVADYDARWTFAHRDACLAHARGEQSAELLDRRMGCLHRGRSGLTTLASLAAGVEPGDLPALALAVRSLPRPEDCGDLERIAASTEPLSPEASAFAERLQAEQVRFRAGHIDASLAATPALVGEARVIGHLGLLAEVLHLHGLLLLERSQRPLAIAAFVESTRHAFAVGDDDLALSSWAQHLWAVGTSGSIDASEAFGRMELMLALAERRGDRVAMVGVLSTLGSAEIGRGHRDIARERLLRAVEIGERIGPAAERMMAAALGNLALVTDDQPERERLLARAVEAWTSAAGPEHPRTLVIRKMAGALTADPAESIAQLSDVCADMRLFHPLERKAAAQCDTVLAMVADTQDDRETARAANDRLVQDATGMTLAFARANAALWSGDADTAASIASAALAERGELADDAPFWIEGEYGEVELALARAWIATGDPRGRELLQRVIVRLERVATASPVPERRRRLVHAQRILAQSK